MAELYNTTCVKASETISDLIICANRATGGSNAIMGEGLLVGGFLIAVFIIMIMMLRKSDFDDAILAAGFVSFLLSIFLRMAGLVSFTLVLAFLLITAGSLLISILTKKK